MPSKALVTSNFTKSEENTQSNYQLFTQYQSEFELNLIDFNKVYNAKENTKILFNPASNELSKKEVVNILDSTLKYTSKSLKTKGILFNILNRINYFS